MNNNIEIKIYRFLSEDIVAQWWLVYQQYLRIYRPSVQSKPIMGHERFKKIINNDDILKISLEKNGMIIGFWLATTNIDNYPESHYSKEYFENRRCNHHLLDNTSPVFLIGDNCGFVLTRDTDDLFKYGILRFIDILNLLKNSLCRYLGKKIVLILNYSEISLKTSEFNYAKELIHKNGKQCPEANLEILDEETFVHIYWRGQSMEKTRVELLLKLFGKFTDDNKNNFSQDPKLIYRITNNFLRNKYSVLRSEVVPDIFLEKCYSLYHNRLRNIGERSPQKLEYSKDEFISYLKDSGFIKYILLNRQNEIKGFHLLISKEFSRKAHWISPTWRIADAYIKLILTDRDVPAYGYIFLFAIGVRDLLRKQGSISDARILADWSEKINGRRFRKDLKIETAPLLPKIIQEGVAKKEGRFFVRVIAKLSNFNAIQIDSDIYLAFY